MKKSLIALALLAGCGTPEPAPGNGAVTGNRASPAGSETKSEQSAPTASAAAGPLTGLYEGGASPQRNQLCIVDKGDAKAQFGLIVRGENLHNCSGVGTAVRSGERLTLAMGGDSACTIDATMAGGTITLPSSLPAGCAYYCGAQAKLTGASFERSGSGAAEAMRARDFAGDPLCEASGG